MTWYHWTYLVGFAVTLWLTYLMEDEKRLKVTNSGRLIICLLWPVVFLYAIIGAARDAWFIAALLLLLQGCMWISLTDVEPRESCINPDGTIRLFAGDTITIVLTFDPQGEGFPIDSTGMDLCESTE